MERYSPEQKNQSSFKLPSPEQWKRLQGGAPEVWLNLNQKNLKVLYFGEDFPPEIKGADIDTPLSLDKYLKLTEVILDTGDKVQVPIFLSAHLHGIPCDIRSREAGGKGYDRYQPTQYDDHREKLKSEGYTHIPLEIIENSYSKSS